MKQIVCINRDETLRMKLKRCKTQDVAYQDEKLRMLQIGAKKKDNLEHKYLPDYSFGTLEINLYTS